MRNEFSNKWAFSLLILIDPPPSVPSALENFLWQTQFTFFLLSLVLLRALFHLWLAFSDRGRLISLNILILLLLHFYSSISYFSSPSSCFIESLKYIFFIIIMYGILKWETFKFNSNTTIDTSIENTYMRVCDLVD